MYIMSEYISQSNVPVDNCSICSESLKEPTKEIFRLKCGHYFHNNCLDDLYVSNNNMPIMVCPICMAFICCEYTCNNFTILRKKFSTKCCE